MTKFSGTKTGACERASEQVRERERKREGGCYTHISMQERQPAAVPELPNNKLHQSPKQSHVMLKIILNRLKQQAEKIIAKEHAGFRAGRSNTEQIFNLRILCEKYLQHQQDLYHFFIDFKKVFDRVLHAAL